MNPKDEALARLQRLPSLPGKKGRVSHGFPVASSAAYGGKVSRKEADDAPVQNVPLAKLHGVQRGVQSNRVAEYLEEGGSAPEGLKSPSGYPRDLPIVVNTGGKLYIHDGHHRMTAQKLMGKTEAPARVVTIKLAMLKRWANRD